ncbi:mitochondrial carrier domain-containing protein [Podospora appendiculata]|uniref:Mitochondrial carrier domain-containing protein n=1 Tax=Podospora appendiculata TaxID=314037 RepID=A0AAE0XHY3_9PEZI|nr:mitochondrial carrier domain-containing protein [Podospora appendiculata]
MASSSGPKAPDANSQNHDRLTHHDSPATTSRMMPTQDDADPYEITAVQKMLSATSGSLFTGLLVTPLDVVRVRWQSQGVSHQPAAEFHKLAVSSENAFRPSNLGVTACCREVFFMNNSTEACIAGPRLGAGGISGGECAVEQTQQRTFTSTIDGLRKIARHEGFTTLWRGLSPTLIMAIPANIIYFTGYDWLRYNDKSPIQQHVKDHYAPLVAGMTARMVAATSVSPVELFRTRLQASHGSSTKGHVTDTFRGIKESVAVHGYRALWRGLTLTLWRDVPFSGMYWLGYETIRGKLTDARERTARGRTLDLDRNDNHDDIKHSQARTRARRRSQSRENHAETFTDSFIAGGLSGAFASIATMPFDVGKTRTQVHLNASGGALAAAAPEERAMGRLLWHIFKTEGAAGLFKGWIPRTLKVAPACAIMISSYEVGKRVFRGVNERALLKERQAEQL